MHNPLITTSFLCGAVPQWKVLEEALQQGRASTLGVYNFCEFGLTCLLETATTPPAYNFIMRHPGMGPDATGIIHFGAAHGILPAVYGTLGEPTAHRELLSSEVLRAIGEAHNRTVEEVALQWNAQAGYAVTNRITSDYAPENEPDGQSYCTADCDAALAAMAQLSEWALTTDQISQIDALSFGAYPQAPTYYSSTGCNASFGVSEHPTASVCAEHGVGSPESSWC